MCNYFLYPVSFFIHHSISFSSFKSQFSCGGRIYFKIEEDCLTVYTMSQQEKWFAQWDKQWGSTILPKCTELNNSWCEQMVERKSCLVQERFVLLIFFVEIHRPTSIFTFLFSGHTISHSFLQADFKNLI